MITVVDTNVQFTTTESICDMRVHVVGMTSFEYTDRRQFVENPRDLPKAVDWYGYFQHAPNGTLWFLGLDSYKAMLIAGLNLTIGLGSINEVLVS